MKNEQIWPEWVREEKLGSGAFGSVYRVKKEQYGITSYAAMKVIEIPQNQSEIRELQNQGLDDMSITAYYSDVAKSLLSEIRIMESLKGAGNIVTIEDCAVKKREQEQGYTIYIRMELLKSLNVYLSEHPMTIGEVVQLGKDICDALTCCQKENIIHRDIKPDNIFVNKYGTFKLGDFGISRQLERTRSAVSQKGTNLYMAPEVFKGEHYTHVVDIYSLGIMLYRLLNNGRFPFMPPAPQPLKYDDAEKALIRRLNGEPLGNPAHADETLSQIIRKAAALSPAMRYQSSEEMKQDLILWEQYNKKAAKSAPAHNQGNENQSQRKAPQEDPNKTIRADAGPSENIYSYSKENLKDSRLDFNEKPPEQAKETAQEPKHFSPGKNPGPEKEARPQRPDGAPPKPAPPKNGKKRALTVGAVLIVCLIGRIFVGYAVSSFFNDDDNAAVSQTTQKKEAAQEPHWEASKELWESLDAYDGQIGDVNYYTSSIETLDQFFEQKGWLADEFLTEDTTPRMSRHGSEYKGSVYITGSRYITLSASSGFSEYSDDPNTPPRLNAQVSELDWTLPRTGLWEKVSFGIKKEDLYKAFNLAEEISQATSDSSADKITIDQWSDADENQYKILINQYDYFHLSESLTLEKSGYSGKSIAFNFDKHEMLTDITISIY